MVFQLPHLLNHVVYVYIIEAFVLFENEFIDGAGYKYRKVKSVPCRRSLRYGV